jgi:hypothetical protein
VLGPARGSKEREILITLEQWQARKSAEVAGSSAAMDAVDDEDEDDDSDDA